MLQAPGPDSPDWSAEEREALYAHMRAAAAAEPSERARRIALADEITAALREIASRRPGGGRADSSEAFAGAMARLPADMPTRRRVLWAATERVRARADITPTAKLLFMSIASMSRKDRHCWLTHSQLALENGITDKSVVSRAVTHLRDAGLIVTFEDQRRQFSVPALMEIDFATAGDLSAFRALRIAASKLVGKAVVIFPCKPAMDFADGLASGVQGQSFKSEGMDLANELLAMGAEGGVDPWHISKLGGKSASEVERNATDPVKSATDPLHQTHPHQTHPLTGDDETSSSDPSVMTNDHHPLGKGSLERDQASLGTASGSARQQAGFAIGKKSGSGSYRQFDPDLYGQQLLSPELKDKHCRVAHEFTSALTRVEIAADYDLFLAKAAIATFGAFVSGLKLADTRKRELAGNSMPTELVNKFCEWDRNRNGNSKATLGQRIARFVLEEAPGYAMRSRKAGAALRNLLTDNPDERDFEVRGDRLVFLLGVREISLPLTALTQVEIGTAEERADALNLVIGKWNLQKKRHDPKHPARLAADLTTEVQAILAQWRQPSFGGLAA